MSVSEPNWQTRKIKVEFLGEIESTSRIRLVKCYHCDLEPPVTDEESPRRHVCLFCKESYPNHQKFKIHFKQAHDRDENCFCYQIPPEKFVTCAIPPEAEIKSEPMIDENQDTSEDDDSLQRQQTKGNRNGMLKPTLNYADHSKPKCYQCEMEPPVNSESDARRHKCLFCKEWFPNHIEFKVHFKNTHDTDANVFFDKLSNCYEFTCYICERDFPLRYYLAAHMKTHFDKFLSHQCPVCGKRYRTYGILTQHLKTHEGREYKCDQCDKVFPHYARLRIHRWCHKTELNYVCDLCSKGFKMRKYLKRHMTMHSQVKQFVCRYCDARFSFTTGRRAHEKSIHKVL